MYDMTEQYNRLADKKRIVVLGIESSCDETAAAIYDGERLLSNIVASQIDIHARFGGVVPEIASRNHTLALPGIIDRALAEAGLRQDDLDAVAVTYGAGLIGALLVGVSSAKAYAYARNLPLVAVNHIEGHICANYLEHPDLRPPFMALVASGGHTSVIEVTDYNAYRLIGSTTDDAIGEAFDKVARLIGLPYPGGAAIDRLSKDGQDCIPLMKHKKNITDGLISYSGLKTAVVNYVHTLRQRGEEPNVPNLCASFTHAAVDPLADYVIGEAKRRGFSTVVLAGGVASNSYLRAKMSAEGEKTGLNVIFPSPEYCTDNGAMVAVRGYLSARAGVNLAGLDLNAVSNLRVPS